MCGCTGTGKPLASPVRASILRKPAGDIGARRSVVNTYRDGIASRWSLRKAVGQPGDRLAKGLEPVCDLLVDLGDGRIDRVDLGQMQAEQQPLVRGKPSP